VFFKDGWLGLHDRVSMMGMGNISRRLVKSVGETATAS